MDDKTEVKEFIQDITDLLCNDSNDNIVNLINFFQNLLINNDKYERYIIRYDYNDDFIGLFGFRLETDEEYNDRNSYWDKKSEIHRVKMKKHLNYIFDNEIDLAIEILTGRKNELNNE